ncbi:Ldh family oxidoreductase [bacterium SCSIO 12827]|nr:Ldh family oxidoreductase [bacterium SCSIO 12827]
MSHPKGDGPRGPAEKEGAQRFACDPLHAFVTDVFVHHGLDREDAGYCADVLIAADARGVWSHGVARVGMYCGRLKAGVAKAHPDIKIDHVADAAALVDGDDGLGLVVARRAMEEAIEISGRTGIAMVGVKNSGHFGMAAHYTQMGTDAGRLTWLYTNASPALPPWGGRSQLFGTNPFSFGAPTKAGEAPFLIDMAMSVVARGKLKFAAQRGDPIPEGLALDRDGRPTTDGMAAFNGVVLPFGGVKGAAMSWMMDVVGGVFTGAGHAGSIANPFKELDRPQNVGHLIVVARADLFQPLENFFEAMTKTTNTAKNSPRAEGVNEIYAPGEIEANKVAESARQGVPLSPDVIADLQDLGRAADVAWPFDDAGRTVAAE